MRLYLESHTEVVLHYILWNDPLLRGYTASSLMHQVQGRKEKGRKEEDRQGEGGACMAHGRGDGSSKNGAEI